MPAATEDRISRVRRWTRRAELVHPVDGEKRDPITIGCWVVVADVNYTSPLELARAIDGPEYVHQDGHAIGEVWTLHDGRKRHRGDLTALDLVGVLEEGATLLADVRCGRYSTRGDQTGILRVHRAACLARRLLDLGGMRTSPEEHDQLEALVHLDQEIAGAEAALRDLVVRMLPNLARSLWVVGACEAARAPGWQPGDPTFPNPHASAL